MGILQQKGHGAMKQEQTEVSTPKIYFRRGWNAYVDYQHDRTELQDTTYLPLAALLFLFGGGLAMSAGYFIFNGIVIYKPILLTTCTIVPLVGSWLLFRKSRKTEAQKRRAFHEKWDDTELIMNKPYYDLRQSESN